MPTLVDLREELLNQPELQVKTVKDYHKGGVVTTCWESVDVISKAHEKEVNLIICHEALFWNHGDHQEWLMESQNEMYKLKKHLLAETCIVVWRNHDYIQSGDNYEYVVKKVS